MSERVGAGPFAQNLATALARHGYTATTMAERFGWNVRHCRRLSSGDVRPHYMEIPMIAYWLGLAPAKLAWERP